MSLRVDSHNGDIKIGFDPVLIQGLKNQEPELLEFEKLSKRLQKKAVEKLKKRKKREQAQEMERQRIIMIENEKLRIRGIKESIKKQIEKNREELNLIKKTGVVCPVCINFLNGISYDKYTLEPIANIQEPSIIFMYENKEGDTICPRCSHKINKNLIY